MIILILPIESSDDRVTLSLFFEILLSKQSTGYGDYYRMSPNIRSFRHGPLIRYAKLRVVHASGMPGTFSPPPPVSDPDMHHGTCVTHVAWRMPVSLTSGFLWSWWREQFPSIPGACITRNVAYLVRGPCFLIDWWFCCHPIRSQVWSH